MVQKEGLAMDEENHDLQDNEQYRGAENPFVYESYLDLNLRCNFKFTTYPFDQQTCCMLVSMVIPLFILTKLSVYLLNYCCLIICLRSKSAFPNLGYAKYFFTP